VAAAATFEVGELGRLLARRGSLSSDETARVQTLMRRNSSRAQQSAQQSHGARQSASVRARGEDLSELGRLLARTGNLSAEDTARVRTLMRRNSTNTAGGGGTGAAAAAAAAATTAVSAASMDEVSGDESSEVAGPPALLPPLLPPSPPPLPFSPLSSTPPPAALSLAPPPALPKIDPSGLPLAPSRAGQEVLYALLRLFEEAPWLVVGLGRASGTGSGDDGQSAPLDEDEAPCVAGGPFPTRGSLRLARVVEVLCALVPLGSLDHATARGISSDDPPKSGLAAGHPSGKSSSSGAGALFVGRRAVAADSREVLNFGGIDLAARARRCLLALLAPAWAAAWCPSDPGAGFVAVSSVVLRTLARHLLHPPPLPTASWAPVDGQSSSPSSGGGSGGARCAPFSAYASEARAARELLAVLSAALALLNAHAAAARQPFGSFGAFGTGFGAACGQRSSRSSTPARVSAELGRGGGGGGAAGADEESDRTRFEARRRVLADARASAVAAGQGACLVQLGSPDAAVCALAANCLALLCDQGDLLDTRSSSSESASLVLSDFLPR
jgi:hypothetical protein